MKPLTASIITLASVISVVTIFGIFQNPPASVASGLVPNPNPNPTPTPETYKINYPRLARMEYLLENYSKEGFAEYKNLCKLAKIPPKIGMTISQSRNSTWCYPYTQTKTTTKYGEHIQEVYLKPDYKGEIHSQHSPRQYLYFDNGILTSIQE